jgi:hypothetical protein
MMCAVASAAESVIVMMKSVAAKPSRRRISNFPVQPGNKSASIAMLPSPFGLCRATWEYTGSAPRSVTATSTRVAIGDRNPAARNAIPG